jgi:hypothetical protein
MPGTYYFDFSPTTVNINLVFRTYRLTIPRKWTVNRGSLVAGTLTGPVTASSEMPGLCKSPMPTGAGGGIPHPGEGVQFVFSGYSQLEISGSARAEICGEYAGDKAPVAIYARQSNIIESPALPTGTLACDVAGVLPCIALQVGTSFGAASPPSELYVHGAVVGPERDINLRVRSDSMHFVGGIVGRRVVVNTSQPTSAEAVFSVQAPIAAAARHTVARLEVKLCPGLATCTHAATGFVALKASVQLTDPGGIPKAGDRDISVLSWSLQQ